MKGALTSILDAVGNTPIVKLGRTAEGLEANVFVKCEYLNPAGSMKDRMVLNLIDAAEKRGELKPGGTIIEATSGNTGAAIAMVSAVRGYKCIFVMPDKMSQEKVSSLKAYGAKVVVCPAAVEPEDPRSYYSVAKRLATETPNSFYSNQYHNHDNPAGHYKSTGPEIWAQTGGEVDVLVAGLGTGGTISGTGRYLKEKKPEIQIVGVDPVGSLYYDYVKSGRVTKPFTYKVEGIGEDFFPSTVDLKILDEIIRVDDKECFTMTRELVRNEGLYVGGSCGAAVAGALKYARQTQRKENILVILADSAAKYLSKIFNDDWMRENGFLEEAPGLGTVSDVLHLRGKHKIVTTTSTAKVKDVIATLKQLGISQLPVVEKGKLRGVIGEIDLLRHLVSGGSKAAGATIASLIESDYATVTPDTKIELLQGVLADARAAIVMERDAVVGIVTKIDLIEFLSKKHAEVIATVKPKDRAKKTTKKTNGARASR